MTTNLEKVKKVRELLKSFDNGMLVTHSHEGDFHARPMMIAEVDEHGAMSFITALDSAKVDEVMRRPDVGMTLQKPGAYVSVVGKAHVVVDVEEKKRVWSGLSNVWFDDPTDPQAALLKVEPELVEYWDNRGVNAVRYALEAVRSVTTGEAPRSDERRHGAVEL